MRALLVVILAGMLAGCEAPGPKPVSPAEKKKAEQTRLDAAISEFLAGYYGKAAAPVRQYIDLFYSPLIEPIVSRSHT